MQEELQVSDLAVPVELALKEQLWTGSLHQLLRIADVHWDQGERRRYSHSRFLLVR